MAMADTGADPVQKVTRASLSRPPGVAEGLEGAGAGGEPKTLEARFAALGFQPQRTDGGGIKLVFGRDILFDVDSAEITPEGRRTVERLVQELAGRAPSAFHGHRAYG